MQLARLALAHRRLVILLLVLVAAGASPSSSHGQPAPKRLDPEDVLGNIVVVPSETSRQAGAVPPKRIKLGMVPSLTSDEADVIATVVVRRDLELSGEFELLAGAPDETDDTTVNIAAWAKAGAETVVRVQGRSGAADQVELEGLAYLVSAGERPLFRKQLTVELSQLRQGAHQLADALTGALTGHEGSAASRLAFVLTSSGDRTVYVIDADGYQPRSISPVDQLAIAPTFDPNGRLYYAASVHHGPFRIYREGTATPLRLAPRGSVYGLAFSPAGSVAAAIAVGPAIKLFTGPDLQQLQQAAGSADLVLEPVFTPSGKIAVAAAVGKHGQQILVDGRSISPGGLQASSPTFCRHPEGTRAVFAVGTSKRTELVARLGERSGSLVRLTAGQGSSSYPACSPDGRLVAFFSTRRSGEGPGLYVMRADGWYAKRISPLMGDSLRWARLPRAAAPPP